MDLQDAIGYIGTIDNASGQLCQMKDGKPHLLLFDFACGNCSEVESRNADDMGEALMTIVNAAPANARIIARLRDELATAHEQIGALRATINQQMPELLEMLGMLCDGLEWNIDNSVLMNESDAEALASARALIAKVRGETT